MGDRLAVVSGSSLLGVRAAARITQPELAGAMKLHVATIIDAENDRLPIGQAGYAALLEAVKAAIERIQSQ
jgi:DNA-binding XRE family transcriptional regulator